jgi:hypothetical protein
MRRGIYQHRLHRQKKQQTELLQEVNPDIAKEEGLELTANKVRTGRTGSS